MPLGAIDLDVLATRFRFGHDEVAAAVDAARGSGLWRSTTRSRSTSPATSTTRGRAGKATPPPKPATSPCGPGGFAYTDPTWTPVSGPTSLAHRTSWPPGRAICLRWSRRDALYRAKPWPGSPRPNTTSCAPPRRADPSPHLPDDAHLQRCAVIQQ